MSPWLVTQDDTQYPVDGIDGLILLAQDGKLTGGDLVQAPGTTEWMYAAEVPQLMSHLTDTMATDDDDDLDYRKRGGKGVLTAIVAVVLLAVIGVGGTAAVVLWRMVPTPSTTIVGNGGLSYTQMLVTQPSAPLRGSPDAGAAPVLALDKDRHVELLAKRGDWYKARTDNGTEGWVSTGHVIPAYQLAGGDAARTYDPLFNPDHYVAVGSASWLQLDQRNTKLTVFRFALDNESQYRMTDLVLLATIKDPRGNELERVEIGVEGEIPASGRTMVGTLAPASDDPDGPRRLITQFTFAELAADDPDLQLRYSDGVEVEMTAEQFTEASIDVLEIRAVPHGE